ncbi:glycoside-pentoside-hexuronide (GPH):cation symporter [Butyricicoccus faecihominis]|uniref:MFS transporter n=1 Tax=Butyricicoccaceae TaxID=3085642 RepID=UPI00247A5171|nr:MULTISPECIES: glycoside-pentoside-hexuronide (GPH):cation symporter [Butyricicoccaceae]MCQ5130146.1 glycoside-pentoside-hexuronide (GPH):cation symporter [Butyricicoccus faecihominis]WNX83452.1 glycoside-pentoside-hexuronide (GPH):cation symporter [Agathobaculum sp. NTUH-O15-33]
MSTAPATVDEYTKLSVPKKIGYACGDFACNMSWSLVSAYLVFFLTDVAMINAATVGIIIFISKFWDAINDPVIGSLADHTNSKWGRYRPWIIFACVPMLVFNVLTFTTNPNWSETARTWWGLGMYFILVLLYTMVNVTYSAMPATMTRDTDTRSALSSYRMTGAFLAMTILSFATLRIVNATGGGATGYRKAALIFSAMALPFFIITILSTKEVVQVDMSKSKKVSFISQFKVLKGNWPVIQIAIAYAGWGIIQGGMTFRLYFCTYNAGNDLLYANTQTLQSILGMVGAFAVSYLVPRVKNKGTISGVAFSLIATCALISFFLPITTPVGQALYYVMNIGMGFGTGMMLGNVFGMMPDTAEYTYHKYGVYCAGFVSTFINFMLKVGQAVAISGASFILQIVGYVPNATQSDAVLFTMNFGSHIFVGLFSIVCAIAMFSYKLDKKTYGEIVSNLRERGLAN